MRIIKKENWFIVTVETKLCIECPVCECINLGDSAPHRIEADGSVKNSVICQCCDFHEYVKIEGWTGGNIK